jgi:predicted nucleic acid-binding protein
MTESIRPVVLDAGPLIHLDELDALDLLDSFNDVIIPQIVWEEVTHHRPSISLANRQTCSIHTVVYPASPTLRMLTGSFALDAGEVAALALAEMCKVPVFLTDDAAARVAGESMGLSVHGTIGVVVRAIRTGQRTKEQVLQMLRSIPEISSLHISRKLLDEVIETVSKG